MALLRIVIDLPYQDSDYPFNAVFDSLKSLWKSHSMCRRCIVSCIEDVDLFRVVSNHVQYFPTVPLQAVAALKTLNPEYNSDKLSPVVQAHAEIRIGLLTLLLQQLVNGVMIDTYREPLRSAIASIAACDESVVVKSVASDCIPALAL